LFLVGKGVILDKRILAIFDGEESYAYRLMEFISEKRNLPFRVYVFTDKKKFYSCAKTEDIECLLVSESVYGQEVEVLKIPHIIILSENGENLNKALHHINKYQSCENILHEVMEYYTEKSEAVPTALRTGIRKMQIIGIYTPIGRCLQTTFSLTLGQMLARRFKTLYLNFEVYSGFSRLLSRTFDSDISDLMYYFACAREKLACRMESMVETVNGLDFIPPAEIYQNLAGIRGSQWMDLFQEIEKSSEYEYLILDLTDSIMDLWEVLKGCDHIYTISRDDGMAMAKIEQYEKVLEQMEYGEITARTTRWKLPVFKQLPRQMEELTYGELAKYIKTKVFPDLLREEPDE
jgi:cellulose biosynthesis protein BcsQ